MKKFALIVLAAVLPFQIAHAQEPAEASVPGFEEGPEFLAALELVQVLAGPELMAVQLDKLFNETFPRAFAANSEMVALETEEPGLLKEMLAAMKPIIEDSLSTSMPGLWNDLAKIYAADLSADEIRKITAFYRSNAGQHLIAAMGEGVDFATVASKSLMAPDDDLQEHDITSGLMAGVAALPNRLSDEDIQAIATFTSKAPGNKLEHIVPKAIAETTRWSNQADPETEAKIQLAVSDVVQRRLAQKE